MIANCITISRIILSIVLLILKPFSLAFLVIYTITGLSDIFDGYVARKTKTSSLFGAKLDTISDLIFFIVMSIILYKSILSNFIWVALIFIILVIRILSIYIVFKKYNTFGILHTYSNKLVGLLLFLIPYYMNYKISSVLITVTCFIALLSAIEEYVINRKSKTYNPDIKSIFKI